MKYLLVQFLQISNIVNKSLTLFINWKYFNIFNIIIVRKTLFSRFWCKSLKLKLHFVPSSSKPVQLFWPMIDGFFCESFWNANNKPTQTTHLSALFIYLSGIQISMPSTLINERDVKQIQELLCSKNRRMRTFWIHSEFFLINHPPLKIFLKNLTRCPLW